MDDLDDLLARRDRADDLVPDGALGDLVDDGLDDGQRDVGFEQRDPHFAHGGAHVELGQRATAAQLVEDLPEAVG